MTPGQAQKLNEVYEFMQALQNTATIPKEVDGAIRDRFGFRGLTPLKGSAKGATSENVNIDEAGSATHIVLNKPDAFIEVAISGTTYYIPVFTS